MKKEKSVALVLVLSFFTILLFVQLTIAQVPFLDDFIKKMGDSFGSIFAPIFGVDSFDQFLFAKILLFFLLYAIIFMSLRKIDLFAENKSVAVIVSIIVSIFAVRFIKENQFINAILLPYGALGITLSIFLPLLIYFYFVHSSGIGPFGRRVAWILYGLVFLFLWGSRPYADLGTANWIYLLGTGFVIVSFLFDSSIHRYFGLAGLVKWKEGREDARIARLQSEYEEIEGVDSPQARRRRRHIERELRRNNAFPF